VGTLPFPREKRMGEKMNDRDIVILVIIGYFVVAPIMAGFIIWVLSKIKPPKN